MADAAVPTQELDWSRELALQKLDDQRAAQQNPAAEQSGEPENVGSSNAEPSGRRLQTMHRQRTARMTGEVATNASAVARQAYARVWQLAEEGVQDFALSFMDLMLISGPAAVAMFVTRLIGGNLFGGSGTISFREVTVPRIPGYSSALEGAYKGGKVLFIGLVTGLLYSIIILLVVMISNPGLLVQIGLCSIFGNLVSFFGSTVCSG